MGTDELLLISAARRHAADGSGRRIRLEARLTLVEVARNVGVTEATLSRWEVGARKPRGDAAIRWLRVLETLAREVNLDDQQTP